MASPLQRAWRLRLAAPLGVGCNSGLVREQPKFARSNYCQMALPSCQMPLARS